MQYVALSDVLMKLREQMCVREKIKVFWAKNIKDYDMV